MKSWLPDVHDIRMGCSPGPPNRFQAQEHAEPPPGLICFPIPRRSSFVAATMSRARPIRRPCGLVRRRREPGVYAQARRRRACGEGCPRARKALPAGLLTCRVFRAVDPSHFSTHLLGSVETVGRAERDNASRRHPPSLVPTKDVPKLSLVNAPGVELRTRANANTGARSEELGTSSIAGGHTEMMTWTGMGRWRDVGSALMARCSVSRGPKALHRRTKGASSPLSAPQASPSENHSNGPCPPDASLRLDLSGFQIHDPPPAVAVRTAQDGPPRTTHSSPLQARL